MVDVSYRAILTIAKRLRELAEQLVALAGRLVDEIEGGKQCQEDSPG